LGRGLTGGARRGEGGGGVTAARGAREGSGGGCGWAATWAQSGGREGGSWAAEAGWAAGGRRLGRKGRRGEGEKKRFFLFFKIYFLDECFHNFHSIKINAWFGMVQQTKENIFRVLLYTRSQAESRVLCEGKKEKEKGNA
jgi:hypothetical protein